MRPSFKGQADMCVCVCLLMCLHKKKTIFSIEFFFVSMNQHQLDTLFLVGLLGVDASTCFGTLPS
jgi:hypothetical protein